jgi:hypothetical protein
MALTNLPDPRLLDWTTWADYLVGSNPHAIRVLDEGEVDDEGQPLSWRDVADRLTMLEPHTPRHDSFLTWQEWAINLMAIFPN